MRTRVPTAPECRRAQEAVIDLTGSALADLWMQAEAQANDWHAIGALQHDPATKAHYAVVVENRASPIPMLMRLRKDADGALIIEARLGPTLPEYVLEGEDPWRNREMVDG